MHDRILIDPKICHGQACIKGTRLPVSQILAMLSGGDTVEHLLAAFSAIERADVMACLKYGASLAEEQIAPIEELPSGA
jgi:uncharacterized protein (DUF433 family)